MDNIWNRARFIQDILDPDNDNDNNNYTCNVVLTKNMTLIEIDRGWEGIPESLVINLFLCMLLILPFVIFHYMAHSKPAEITSTKTNWLQFIYGNRDIKKKSSNYKNLHLVETYFKSVDSQMLALLPYHLASCKNNCRRPKSSYGSSSSTSIQDPSASGSSAITQRDINCIKIENDEEVVVAEPNFERHPSSRNLVQNETTFPVHRQFSNYSAIFLHFRKSPVNFIQNCFSNLMNISDRDILRDKGHNAFQYLQFQRYIIIFFTALTLECLLILLPIHVCLGSNDGKAFARTTLGNLAKESNLYWIHAVLSNLMVILGVYLMNRFSSELKTDDDLMFRKTLLIRRIPVTSDVKLKLEKYFEENFPNVKLTGVQLIYDYRTLEGLEQDYINTLNAKTYCETKNANHEERLMLRPYCCSKLCCCFSCCCHKVDAAEYYANEKNTLENKINDDLQNLPTRPTGSAFIAFETEQMAIDVFTYIKTSRQHLYHLGQYFCFSASESLDLANCLVNYAPYPDDVNWRDIATNTKLLWLRKFCISILLFIIFFFLSTPAFLLKFLELIANKELLSKGIGKITSTFTDFLSPFLLMLLAVVLPSIVTYACSMIPYKTISNLNHAIMSKVYVYLLMMIIILPSAGFLSINAMMENLLLPNSDQNKFRWHCLFPVDNGAFFVIYALQSGLVGNVAEILRIPELLLYGFYNLVLRSSAEFGKSRKWVTFDFPFGVSYSRFLLIFTMTVIYSQACPLIAPCGLIYMIGKHLVDRYNIFYVYTPTQINGRIHSSAILYVHIGLILMQFQLFAFMLTKTQYSNVTVFMFIFLLISLLAFIFYCFQHWFRNNNNHISINARTSRFKRDFCICSYTPSVLYRLLNDGLFHQPPPITASSASNTSSAASECDPSPIV